MIRGYYKYAILVTVAMLPALLAGCGNNGRDSILGNGGNPALAPTVTAVTPLNGATSVPLNNPLITATFSKDMDPSTITSASFTISCQQPCVAPTGTVSYNAGTQTAVFTLNKPLVADTTYTATITTAAKDLAGIALVSNYVWTFATAPSPPTVTAVAPINGATGVPINNTIITAAFSEPMAPITGSASFTLTCAAPCTSPVGTVTLDASNTIATFALAAGSNLSPSTNYTATVTGATSLATGLPLAVPYVWHFTTGVAPDTTRPRVTVTVPVTTSPGPTPDVPINTAISATFTEDMNPATINASSFTLTCAAPCTNPTGTVSYVVGSRTAVFTPDTQLEQGTTYTATITTAAEDLAGNQLAGNQAPLPAASDYIWTFTTVAAVPPQNVSVQSTLPADGDVAVCPNATINATFDVPSGLQMNPTTVNTSTFIVTGPPPAFTSVTAASVALDAGTGQIATFTPLNDLTPGLTYTATITGGANGVKDMANPANTMVSDYTWSFTVGPATGNCLNPVPIGLAVPFGTFGGSAGMTNQGLLSVINGDIGTTAVSTAVTGFHDSTPGCIYTETPLNIGTVNGTIFTAPPIPAVACPTEGTAETFAIATAARAAALDAYNYMVALPAGPDPGSGNLANLVLTPGVYTAALGTFMIQGGDLTLDAQGNANAVWVFQMAGSLTVGGPGAAYPQSVILVNGAQAKNVFWQVGSAATINAAGGGTMVGTIITQSGADISTPGNTTIVTLDGRVLSLGASVTLVDTVVNVPAP
ncbi:MAG: Ig-like domain-containing protein [Gammaproteobacteria bacterium]